MLKKGSHVTLVTPVSCHQTMLVGATRSNIEWAPSSYLAVKDEGKLWLRGWHSPESRAAKAAVVAQGLTTELDVPRKRPTLPPSLPANTAATIIGAAAGAIIANILTAPAKKAAK